MLERLIHVEKISLAHRHRYCILFYFIVFFSSGIDCEIPIGGATMSTGLSDKIRKLAKVRYVDPAISAGEHEILIRVKDVFNDLNAEGLPGVGHTPQICSALRTRKFLRENGLESIEMVEGPISGQSPSVVYRYKVGHRSSGQVRGQSRGDMTKGDMNEAAKEDSGAWAERVTSEIRGLLKDEIAKFGGTEGFIRWVRSEDGEPE